MAHPKFDPRRPHGEIYGEIGHIGYAQDHCIFNIQGQFVRRDEPVKPKLNAMLPAADAEEDEETVVELPAAPEEAPAEEASAPADGYSRYPFSSLKQMCEKRGYAPRDKADAIKFLRNQIAA